MAFVVMRIIIVIVATPLGAVSGVLSGRGPPRFAMPRHRPGFPGHVAQPFHALPPTLNVLKPPVLFTLHILLTLLKPLPLCGPPALRHP